MLYEVITQNNRTRDNDAADHTADNRDGDRGVARNRNAPAIAAADRHAGTRALPAPAVAALPATGHRPGGVAR